MESSLEFLISRSKVPGIFDCFDRGSNKTLIKTFKNYYFKDAAEHSRMEIHCYFKHPRYDY